MLDLLSDILTKLSVRGALYFRTSLTTPWGIEVPKFENVARFHFAHRGNCLIEVKGYEKVVALEQGDLLIIPHGASHKLYCAAETRDAVLPLDTVIERSGYTGTGVLVYGGDGDERDTHTYMRPFFIRPSCKTYSVGTPATDHSPQELRGNRWKMDGGDTAHDRR